MQASYYEFPQIQAPLYQPRQPAPEIPAPVPSTPPPGKKGDGNGSGLAKIAGVIVLLLVLIAGAFGAGLYAATKIAVRTPAAAVQPVKTDTAASAPKVHFIVSVGTPVQPKNPVSYTTKIGVPASLQAVRYASTNQNASLGFTLFGNGTYNNELARIAFGNPSNPSENGGGLSELALTAITKEWLASTGATDNSPTTGGFPSGVTANALQSPADKKAFMDALPNATSICAKDSTKGFKTDDGTLSACYIMTYGKDGYAPVMTLLGYSNVDNQPAVLYGSIFIYDTSVAGTVEAQHAAIQAAHEGKPTTVTTDAQAELLAALKQSSVIITKN